MVEGPDLVLGVRQNCHTFTQKRVCCHHLSEEIEVKRIKKVKKKTKVSVEVDVDEKAYRDGLDDYNQRDELIFSGEYTKAMSKDWHTGHFCCWQCDESLTGQRYVLRDDHPYCVRCYEQVFANTCEECQKSIGIDSKDLSYKEKHWHENCFLCNKCRVSLVDKPFGSKAEKVYCAGCYDAAFATRCDEIGRAHV